MRKVFLLFIVVILFAGCAEDQKKWRIGVSQCSEDIPADTPKSESPFLERFRSILQQNLSDADFNVERIKCTLLFRQVLQGRIWRESGGDKE